MIENIQHALDTIGFIYREGDIDLIFFGHILGMVSNDAEDLPLNKTPARRVADAISLVEFLVSTGDFYVGHTIRGAEGKYTDVPFPRGISEFKEIINDIFLEEGLDGDNLIVSSWIRKLNIGSEPPVIPNRILEIFK
ncbi:hypothetical protein G6K93_18490 [Agrobacterium rhizogenes]|nr:hypothetical protein [Rhizobium rhizogenes]NTJ49002.1 hypothetical protein [Rhizobium rhizogenes]